MVKTLVELCTEVCVKNISYIDDVGDAPYKILRPILLKIDDYQKLLELEEKSPHLRGDTDECWKRIIMKIDDYRKLLELEKQAPHHRAITAEAWKRLVNHDFLRLCKTHPFEPSNSEPWSSKVYMKYKAVNDKQKAAALAKLEAGFNNIEKEKQAKAASTINYDPKLLGPAPGRRKVPGWGGRTGTGELRFGGGSRTKTTSARSIMLKARREAAEMHRRNKLTTPTGQLSVPQGQIAQAPLSMREAYRIKSLPTTKIHPPLLQKNSARSARLAREDKERDAALLRAKNEAHTTAVSDEDLFSEGDDFDYPDEGEGSGQGGLTIEDLEGSWEEANPLTPTASTDTKSIKTVPTSQRKNSSSLPSASSPTSKGNSSSMSGLAKMKLGRSWRDKPIRIEPVEKSTSKATTSKPTASSPTESKPTSSYSLPSQSSTRRPSSSTNSRGGSPTAGPSGSNVPKAPAPLLRKRKEAPCVFMRPMSKPRKTT
ncbi:uncharacterized protein F4822DRAFT_387647 [Hypoxylon trugodes]|uniref:uncharacterized protein n=1 Tax=Hypoxylon trugodes TaxID=326681 RepID=UPI0021A1581D|nr:uncharacterized protein F4822DRAFT_387647 [Hypoxylon trugodes]KAI1394245.1 hypothetical protein F4822DRAFT_387647 [Hypoxylon trugodes]